jgi:hypothetical protein
MAVAIRVVTANHDADLNPQLLDFADLPGNLSGRHRADAERLIAHEGFAGQLQEDTREDGLRHWQGL